MFNPTEYQQVFGVPGVCKIYTPLNAGSYHISRLQEAMRMNVFATNGISEESLLQHYDAILELCNQIGERKTILTDIGALVNSLKVRMKHFVDPPSGLRLGVCLTFIEYYETIDDKVNTIYENPDKVEWYFSKKKIDLALTYPELFAFFLTWGGANSTKSKEYLDTLNDSDSLLNRTQMLMQTLPETLSQLSRI